MINYTKLRGERVLLRPVKKSDIRYTLKWRNNTEFTALNLSLRVPITEEMEGAWFSKVLSGESNSKIVYTVEDIEDGQPAGLVVLSGIDWISGTAIFGISIGEAHKRGRGMGSEAMDLIIKYAFEYLNLRKICLTVAEYAVDAARIYEKYGFKTEGIQREHIYLNNEYYDLKHMALFKEEYYSNNDGRSKILITEIKQE